MFNPHELLQRAKLSLREGSKASHLAIAMRFADGYQGPRRPAYWALTRDKQRTISTATLIRRKLGRSLDRASHTHASSSGR
jgi:hypothetical protein